MYNLCLSFDTCASDVAVSDMFCCIVAFTLRLFIARRQLTDLATRTKHKKKDPSHHCCCVFLVSGIPFDAAYIVFARFFAWEFMPGTESKQTWEPSPTLGPLNPKIDPLDPQEGPLNPKIDPLNPKRDPLHPQTVAFVDFVSIFGLSRSIFGFNGCIIELSGSLVDLVDSSFGFRGSVVGFGGPISDMLDVLWNCYFGSMCSIARFPQAHAEGSPDPCSPAFCAPRGTFFASHHSNHGLGSILGLAICWGKPGSCLPLRISTTLTPIWCPFGGSLPIFGPFGDHAGSFWAPSEGEHLTEKQGTLFKRACFKHTRFKNTCFKHQWFTHTCFKHTCFRHTCFKHACVKHTCFTHTYVKHTCFRHVGSKHTCFRHAHFRHTRFKHTCCKHTRLKHSSFKQTCFKHTCVKHTCFQQMGSNRTCFRHTHFRHMDSKHTCFKHTCLKHTCAFALLAWRLYYFESQSQLGLVFARE